MTKLFLVLLFQDPCSGDCRIGLVVPRKQRSHQAPRTHLTWCLPGTTAYNGNHPRRDGGNKMTRHVSYALTYNGLQRSLYRGLKPSLIEFFFQATRGILGPKAKYTAILQQAPRLRFAAKHYGYCVWLSQEDYRTLKALSHLFSFERTTKKLLHSSFSEVWEDFQFFSFQELAGKMPQHQSEHLCLRGLPCPRNISTGTWYMLRHVVVPCKKGTPSKNVESQDPEKEGSLCSLTCSTVVKQEPRNTQQVLQGHTIHQ